MTDSRERIVPGATLDWPSGTGVAFVVPAYREEASIAAVIHGLADAFPRARVIVVNDGSPDGTSRAARETRRATVLDLPVNLGIGGAVQTGFKLALALGSQVVIQVDGDGQHPAHQIRILLDAMTSSGADVVIGSRFREVSSFRSTGMRRLGIGLLRLTNRFVAGVDIADSTSGFRAYNAAALAFLAQRYPADYPEPEAVVMLARAGFRLHETGVVMTERHTGQSSIRGWKSAYYMAKVLLAIALHAFRPAGIR
ncbi:MAG: glycosyltransferase family 2 protein [Candidatus Sericytochromatia bacterium]|nr:glycosyltransferase family 2 protein [Candidatus Sericytochromatia bacterium]